MISAQTLRVCREGKPVPTFPDHALTMPATPVAVSAAAEIRHLHQLRNHAHHVTAAGTAEHAREVAAAHAHAITLRREARAATESAGHAAKTAAAVLHHPAHHRPHGLHQLAEAALAHLGFHHFEHRRHLGHHVAASSSAVELGHRRH